MEAVRVENLTKSFGSHKVLDRLSFQVETGTICGFIGPNGSGKTTTIRILLGLLKKGGGRVQVLGEDVEFGKESQVKARIAFLQQDPVFPERHTGREVMDLVARLYGMESSYARQRTDELLNEFHLEKAANRSAAVYSKGMKQRLGLAACFLPGPQLLILDEPVSALDPEGRVEVFDIIRRVKGKSTVLFSSHILEDVEESVGHARNDKGRAKGARGHNRGDIHTVRSRTLGIVFARAIRAEDGHSPSHALGRTCGCRQRTRRGLRERAPRYDGQSAGRVIGSPGVRRAQGHRVWTITHGPGESVPAPECQFVGE